jgi:hypothetical protein
MVFGNVLSCEVATAAPRDMVLSTVKIAEVAESAIKAINGSLYKRRPTYTTFLARYHSVLHLVCLVAE